MAGERRGATYSIIMQLVRLRLSLLVRVLVDVLDGVELLVMSASGGLLTVLMDDEI